MTTLAPTQSTEIQIATAKDWKQSVNDWLTNLGSDRTRRAYREAWSAFIHYLKTSDDPKSSPAEVNQSDVIAYRSSLEAKTLTQSTINLHLSALSSFFNFAKSRGLREDNPVDGVTRKSVSPYGRATWLDPEKNEDIRLLEAIDQTTTKGKRDRAIVLLFLTRGLRVESVSRLKVSDLRRQGDAVFLTVTAKGNKTREVKLPTVTAEAIDDYLKTREGLTDLSPVFVATEEGRQAARQMGRAINHDDPLTTRAIAYLLKSYCDKAFGRGHGIHPHSLRHTAAKIAEAEGHRMTEISDLLGHASLQVTTIYLHATSGAADKVAATIGRRYAAVERN
jgi:integrase/recombinase XerC